MEDREQLDCLRQKNLGLFYMDTKKPIRVYPKKPASSVISSVPIVPVAPVAPMSVIKVKPKKKVSVEPEKDCISRSRLPLKEHQKHVVKSFINSEQHGLLAIHAVGSGKTLTAVAASQCFLDMYPDQHIIVITPTSLADNFRKEMIAYDPKINMKKYQFLTYDGFLSRGADCFGGMLIIDEVHNLRTPIKFKNGEVSEGKKVYQIIQCAKESFKVLALTATPVVNEMYDLANLFALVRGEDPPKRADFTRICKDPDDWATYTDCYTSMYEPDTELTKVMYPRTVMNEEFLIMPPEYEEAYDEAASAEGRYAATSTAFYNTVRQVSNVLDNTHTSPKIIKVMDIIHHHYTLYIRFIETGAKFKGVIFSHFIEAGLKIIKEKLDKMDDIMYMHIDGSMTQAQRTKAVEAYNNDEIQILIISKAGGEGLDLKETSFIILLEPSWNPSVVNQVVGRGVRFGSHIKLPEEHRVVHVYKLYLVRKSEYDIIDTDTRVTKDLSVDLYLRSMIKRKEDDISFIMDKLRQGSIEVKHCTAR